MSPLPKGEISGKKQTHKSQDFSLLSKRQLLKILPDIYTILEFRLQLSLR